jgi:predicted dinucleotide-binding enzyme
MMQRGEEWDLGIEASEKVMGKVGVIGSGEVGETLANGFGKHGHEVMRGSRDPSKLDGWKRSVGAKGHTGTFEETARFGDVVVLAVKGTAAEEAVALAGSALDGKVVLDATNPIDEKPPTDGVVAFFTGPNDSLLERLQKRAPKARFVKAFSSVGSNLMVNPKLPAKPTMFICGNDAAAKEEARTILDAFGWETEDCGTATAARAIEPLCMLWCIPGFLKNDWAHAFKVLR